MRQARIKIPPAEGEACYHCITRTVNRERLFDDVAQDTLRRQLWQVADYCGVQVVTYAVLSNHFHVLVRVPRAEAISDLELLRRYGVLYPQPTKHRPERIETLQAILAENGEEAAAWRRRHLAQMGDLSTFMKMLKQRFSRWFNDAHQRIGTLWAERFKSTLIEGQKGVLLTTAAYIDLNGVRAGLATDPKDYRFCGYSEAVAGKAVAQAGLRLVIGDGSWDEVQAQYRLVLFGKGAKPREGAARIAPKELQRVLEEGGKLPLATVLLCHVRYFTDGAVLGGKAFVEQQLVRFRKQLARRSTMGPQLVPLVTDWGELATLRKLRHRAFA